MRCINLLLRRAWLATVLLLIGCVALAPAPSGTAGKAASAKIAAKPNRVEPPVSAESRQMYEQALVALKAGRYPEAERVLLAMVGREPTLAGPRANLGIVYANTNRAALAIESLQQAIRLNPDSAAYYNELGLVCRREGKFEDARRNYARALDLDPNYAFAHLNMGILYDLYLSDMERAMQHYQRYRELAPSEAGTVTKWIADLQQRGRALEQAKRGKSG